MSQLLPAAFLNMWPVLVYLILPTMSGIPNFSYIWYIFQHYSHILPVVIYVRGSSYVSALQLPTAGGHTTWQYILTHAFCKSPSVPAGPLLVIVLSVLSLDMLLASTYNVSYRFTMYTVVSPKSYPYFTWSRLFFQLALEQLASNLLFPSLKSYS